MAGSLGKGSDITRRVHAHTRRALTRTVEHLARWPSCPSCRCVCQWHRFVGVSGTLCSAGSPSSSGPARLDPSRSSRFATFDAGACKSTLRSPASSTFSRLRVVYRCNDWRAALRCDWRGVLRSRVARAQGLHAHTLTQRRRTAAPPRRRTDGDTFRLRAHASAVASCGAEPTWRRIWRHRG